MPYDAVIVGSGPNGLSAAITLAQAGCSVLVVEGADAIGGGLRSAELTLPGFVHDVCSAVHPLGVASPFFSSLDLEAYGLRWVYPPAALAHPLDDGSAILLTSSAADTAARLKADAYAYRRLMSGLVSSWPDLIADVLGPLGMPRNPLAFARFGLLAMQPAGFLARRAFRGMHARALFAGLAAHSTLPLSAPFTAAFGLVLGLLGHVAGPAGERGSWPVARGGSQRIADALAACLRSLGGEIETGMMIQRVDEIPPAELTLLDLTPRQIVAIAGSRLPPGYTRKLSGYRYGAGVFKVDYTLDRPIPWRAAECLQAGTVHLGGTLEEIEAAEAAVARGEHPDPPFVILTQQSLFDRTRAPGSAQTAWAYCHVPNGSTVDMTDRIETQIKRFAPGFRSSILARSIRNCADMERYNPNYCGGDINGGVQDWRQLFTRPVARLNPYTTPVKGLFICSSSTPPGGGVHGMCGYHAARSAMRSIRTD